MGPKKNTKGAEKKGTEEKGKAAAKGSMKGGQSINVRHILCEKHAKKEEALAKLREGSQFNVVATNFSEDKARQGGSLGWQSKGSLDPAFEAVAYGLEPSTTANPKYAEVKTSAGYHIVMVEGRK
ncbi:Peptidyl-prolyl cis-trans isomerase pin4 [Penicillium macrosclerotiorum]|uniref:Peptidyl-prolyl cis-trans isomerase pin4 n=1 Tax=Penicillium macrosclerotiorum TaxID=303699 RepID=UPI00254898C2|nr:Peptidyl-prolyl cis-trans isomerase pin4 [Penicillium macrosclerotiorum]KAJ5678894.1 Peptidyl-prolyl cis-trans isomerase pin4 [Penicillium macrosclerotiorum]